MAQAAIAHRGPSSTPSLDRNNVEGFEVIKNWVTVASIAAFAFDLAGSSAFAADKPVYAVLMKTLSNQFFIAAAKGVDEGARLADVDIILAEGQTGQWAESQVSACETMLERRPAVMIAAAINSTILLPCLKHFNEVNIPVVDLDNNRDSGDDKEGGRRNRLPHRLGERGGGRDGSRLSRERARQGRQGTGAGDRRHVRQRHRSQARARLRRGTQEKGAG